MKKNKGAIMTVLSDRAVVYYVTHVSCYTTRPSHTEVITYLQSIRQADVIHIDQSIYRHHY